ASFASGFIWGILQIVLGDAWILTPLQAFIEYFIAFAFFGFAGLFMNQIKRNLIENNISKDNFYIILAFIFCYFVLFFCNFFINILLYFLFINIQSCI